MVTGAENPIPGDVLTGTAVLSDVPFLKSLQWKNAGTVGYIPRPALERYIEAGEVITGAKNGQEAGYLLGTAGSGDQPTVAKVFQACVELDARRESVGRALVEEFVKRAGEEGAVVVRLWCADDNPSGNEFWAAAGFSPVAVRVGGKYRGRVHVMWERLLTGAPAPLPSARRRGPAGAPVMLHPSFSGAEVLALIRAGDAKVLLR